MDTPEIKVPLTIVSSRNSRALKETRESTEHFWMAGRQTAPSSERSALNWREGISEGKTENKIPGKADGLE